MSRPTSDPSNFAALDESVVALARELATVAASKGARLSVTVEVESIAAARTPLIGEGSPTFDTSQYVSLLRSATRRLYDLDAARELALPRSAAAAAAAAGIEGELGAVARAVGFWHPDHLFDDAGPDMVAVPPAYLVVGAESPESMEQVLWAELDYIEAQAAASPATVCPVAMAADDEDAFSPQRIIAEIKKILRGIAEPEVETTATSLSAFQKNWTQALEDLTERSISGSSNVINSLAPIDWDNAVSWLRAVGTKLPRGILELPEFLQQLLRWLLGWLDKIRHWIQTHFHIDVDFQVWAGKRLLKELREQTLTWVANAFWQTKELTQQVDAAVLGAIERLELPKSTARLSARRRSSLTGCLENTKDTVCAVSQTMFGIDKLAWVAGFLLPKLAVAEPGPFVEIGIGAIIVAALGLIVGLGGDALRDRVGAVGRYRGIGNLALDTLRALQ